MIETYKKPIEQEFFKESLTGGEALVRSLQLNGVEYVFGYTGGAELPISDAFVTEGEGIQFIMTRDERSATLMADGYARISGKPGVVLVTSGPGATNALTGALNSSADNVPLLIISGQVPRRMIGKDAFQEVDIETMSRPVTKHSEMVKDTNDIPRAVNNAFQVANSGRPRPVWLDIPKDIASNEFTGVLSSPAEPEVISEAIELDDIALGGLERIAKAWRTAEDPVILAGRGVRIAKAEKELIALAKQEDTPITPTLLAKGTIPEDDPLYLGAPGMHGLVPANKALIEADFIFMVGSSADDRIVSHPETFGKDAFIAHIDIDEKQIGKIIQPNEGVVADARVALKALLKIMEQDEGDEPIKHIEWNARLAKYKEDYSLSYEVSGRQTIKEFMQDVTEKLFRLVQLKRAEGSQRYETNTGLTMQQVIDEVSNLTEGNATVATDVGQAQMWTMQFYKSKRPNAWLSSGRAGTMGYGVPAAIGAQIAAPKDLVIAIVGDGGFQMTFGELATARRLKLPIKIIILDNGCLGLVRQWQEMFLGNREIGVDMSDNPNFVKLAKSYGLKGIRIKSSGHLKRRLKKALEHNDGPVVVHAIVNRGDNVFPMVPSGAPLENMLIEQPSDKLPVPTGST
ncbi:thiamine pyrophosphate-binding protein [Candidatus Saccharibacteria bacterium]|nr:thiamine pyrophosphate-binding protein [Candidatus Saccharibacteria bacterium]